MARYRDRSREQAYMLPVHLQDQLQPGTFEHTIDYLVDNEIDLSGFDSRYKNDETGAPAYDRAVLLKIILFAYSLVFHMCLDADLPCSRILEPKPDHFAHRFSSCPPGKAQQKKWSGDRFPLLTVGGRIRAIPRDHCRS